MYFQIVKMTGIGTAWINDLIQENEKKGEEANCEIYAVLQTKIKSHNGNRVQYCVVTTNNKYKQRSALLLGVFITKKKEESADTLILFPISKHAI